MKKQVVIVLACAGMLAPDMAARAFELGFDWGNIPRCTSGTPNRVASPTFTVSGLPAGTAAIKFKLSDQDVPGFDHGGGTAPYAGGATVASGAFRYLSPCPPNGRHTYSWSATAVDASGKRLDTGKASKQYP